MGVTSAGLLLFRISAAGVVEVLLAHPGGPFWVRRDKGAWSVPKGECGAAEDPLHAARREFAEETGFVAPAGDVLWLGQHRQAGGKRVTVWALEGDLDATLASSNTFQLEWPRGSGTMREFPEVDRVEWMAVSQARSRLIGGQVPFLTSLMDALADRGRSLREGPPAPTA